jgi:hypothetical protein
VPSPGTNNPLSRETVRHEVSLGVRQNDFNNYPNKRKDEEINNLTYKREAQEEIEGMKNYSRNYSNERNKKNNADRSKYSRSRLESFSEISGNSLEEKKFSPKNLRKEYRTAIDNISSYNSNFEISKPGFKMFETSKYSLNCKDANKAYQGEISRTNHRPFNKTYESKVSYEPPKFSSDLVRIRLIIRKNKLKIYMILFWISQGKILTFKENWLKKIMILKKIRGSLFM